MKSAKLELYLRNLEEAQRLMEQALPMYADTPKMYIIAGRIAEQQQRLECAKLHYKNGVGYCVNHSR